VGGAIAVILLGAVPVLALTTLSPRVFATPQPGKTEADAGVATGPFTFDAPTNTLNRQKGGEDLAAAGEKAGNGQQAAVLLTDWKYTLTTQDLILFFLLQQQADSGHGGRFFHRHRPAKGVSQINLLLFLILFREIEDLERRVTFLEQLILELLRRFPPPPVSPHR